MQPARATMPNLEGPWYTVTEGLDLKPLKHVFQENELASALQVYRIVVRDVPPDYRIGIRRNMEASAGQDDVYKAEVWKGHQLLIQTTGLSIRQLLSELRGVLAELEPPVEW